MDLDLCHGVDGLGLDGFVDLWRLLDAWYGLVHLQGTMIVYFWTLDFGLCRFDG